MYVKKIPITLECGLHLFMEILSGKWKLSLVWSIHAGIKRPSDLHRKIPSASRRVLDAQLDQLIKHGIITKKIIEERPLKVEYELTDLGESLLPVIRYTAQWGEDHRDELEARIT